MSYWECEAFPNPIRTRFEAITNPIRTRFEAKCFRVKISANLLIHWRVARFRSALELGSNRRIAGGPDRSDRTNGRRKPFGGAMRASGFLLVRTLARFAAIVCLMPLKRSFLDSFWVIGSFVIALVFP